MKAEWAALIGVLGASLITALGTLMARRAGRPVDAATIRHTEQQVAATAVSTAKALIDEVREQQVNQKADYESRIAALRADHAAELAALRSRVAAMEDRQTRFMAAIVAHMPWDTDALTKLRQNEPGWPTYPPLDGI